MITRIFILFFILLPGILLGQEEGEPTSSAVKLDFKLPTAISNHSFKTIMSGLADVDLNYTYHFENLKLNAGIGVKYGYWNVESANFSNDVVTGRLEILSPFLNVGYRSILSEKTFFDIELNGGYGAIFTTSNKCADRYNQNTFVITPKVSFYLRATDLLYFGFNASYSYMGAEFTPENLCMQDFPAGNDSFNKGNYQYFSVGFGFYAIIPTFK